MTEPQGVQPVLDAIDVLYAELESYLTGEDPNFGVVRDELKAVLNGVKETLISACSQYDQTHTYRAWKMQGIE
jgi:hypothetical protein